MGNRLTISDPGSYDLPSWLNDKASSIYVEYPWAVKLYQDSGSREGCVLFDEKDLDFADNQFNNGIPLNDNVSSVNVYRDICPAPCGGSGLAQVGLQGICSGPTRTPTSPGPGPTTTPTPTQIPTGNWHVEYFNDTNLNNRCYDAYESATYLFKDWGEDAPAGGCSSDNWSARFTRAVHFQSGFYTFGLGSDDWGRIKLGSDTVVDNWQGRGQHYESRSLSDGDYDVTVEFADTAGLAKLAAWWWGPGFEVPRESQDTYQWYAGYWGNKDLWWDSVVQVGMVQLRAGIG
jgi:hypothetical protein